MSFRWLRVSAILYGGGTSSQFVLGLGDLWGYFPSTMAAEVGFWLVTVSGSPLDFS